MAKIEQYFNSQEELNQYYPNGVPSTVLAIVKNGTNGVLMYTYDNNAPGITGGSEIGGYPEDYSYAVVLSSYTLVGDPNAPSKPANWIFDQDVDDVATEYTFSFNNATKAILEKGTSENPIYLGTLVAPDANTIDIKGYYADGYWNVGDLENWGTIAWWNGREATDSDSVMLYGFDNPQDSSFYDNIIIELVYDENYNPTGEVRIYTVNNYTMEDDSYEISIGYTD